VKLCPDDGVAVSVTLVPDAKLALHAVPQLMPEGAEVTDPEPLTDVLSRYDVGPLAPDRTSHDLVTPQAGSEPKNALVHWPLLVTLLCTQLDPAP
jgi:hypothetical protein